MDVTCDFTRTVSEWLQEGKIDNIASLLETETYLDDINNNSWDLIPIMCKYLNKDTETKDGKIFECCLKFLSIIAANSKPEEALLQLIEEIESAQDDTAFLTLLEPLQSILQRIPRKRHNSFAWCFNAIQSYIQQLEKPQNWNLENEEKVLLDADPAIDRITNIFIHGSLPFYEVFVNELDQDKSENLEELRLILCKFMIQMLDKPLSHLNMEIDGKTKSHVRRVVERICRNIIKIIPDPLTIIYIQQESTENAIYRSSNLSQAIFFYLVFAEQLFYEKIPQVYDPIFIFQSLLHLAVELLDNNTKDLVTKGLKFSQDLIQRVKGHELSYSLLDSESHGHFCKKLSQIIVYSAIEQNRKFSLNLFQTYLDSFETRGRYLLIYNLVNVVNHTGLIGFLITYYKNMLNKELNNNEKNLSIYLCGQKMFNLLNIFCYLHKKEESDLVELADQIISSLNLLRYLAIRDKKNVTKIWDYFETLDKNYCEPLRKGLALSRAHYELKINELKNESANGDKSMHTKVSVTVGGHNLPEMPFNEKIKVLRSALTAFDVMESVLARLRELIGHSTS